MEPEKPTPAVFGTVLGITHGGCEVYSCDYDTADQNRFANPISYESYHEGIYTGFKYQCVELARRYLLINYGVIFDSIPTAYDMFELKYYTRIADKKKFVISCHENGSTTLPVKGSLLIWYPQGEFKRTGHVAVVIDVQHDHIDIAEQNVDDTIWIENYSRRLKTVLDE
jgi:glutathionylspermidine amidase/synthetase